MVVMRRAYEADFVFNAKEYAEELRVLRFNGTESISEPFIYKIKIAGEDANIDFKSIIGKPAYLSISGETGERYVNGIVNKFTQGGTGNRWTIYHVELVPLIWILSMRYDSRIFQEMDVQEIITAVLKDAGIPSDYYSFKLQGTHPKREYCVQYRESDLNFISRLMEEEGIFYFFDHQEDIHVMTIADNGSVHNPIESPEIVFNEQSGMVEEQEFIYSFRFSQQIRPSAYSLRDYNFKQPSLGDMPVISDIDDKLEEENELKIYDYPGKYVNESIGKEFSSIRIEEIRASQKIGIGNSVCRRFLPGYKFKMNSHPREDFNQEYIITRLYTNASQPLGEDMGEEGLSFSNGFECIPSSTIYRPSRKSYKPIIDGVQTAIVVGPEGEEIYTDEYGRVKVKFYWSRGEYQIQREEESSCWMRVSQLWAGESWGAMFIPRIGQEVIVSFEEGDPDRPIITGRVYNGNNMPPYMLPDDKTKSTIKSNSSPGGKGFNEIRFEDNKGKEEIYVHAQKDMNEVINNNMSTRVGNNQSLSVGNNRTKDVGNDETNTIQNNRTTEIVNGDDTLMVSSGSRSITIEKDLTLTINSGNRTTEIVLGNDELNIDTGDRVVNISLGNDNLTISTGNRSVTIDTGNDSLTVSSGSKSDSIKGPYDITVSSDHFKVTCGASSIELSQNGTIQIKGMDILIEGTADIKIKGMNIESTAQVSNNTNGAMVLSEASAINTIKGGMVMLNP